MKPSIVLLLLCVWVTIVFSEPTVTNKRHERFLAAVNGQRSIQQEGDLPKLWYTQKLNHFDAEDQRTFEQKYYVNSEFFQENGPVFLYIGGEGPLRSSNLELASSAMAEHGKKLGALLVAVEHRYYGETQPFDELTYSNLEYLTVDQALGDLAMFITDFPIASYEVPSSDNQTHDWISFGGSYAGAVSSWLRLKYPHLITGSIASSGPVHAKLDFYEYDQSISEVLKEHEELCYSKTKKVFDYVDAQMKIDPVVIKTTLGLQSIVNDTSALYIMADATSFAVQYNTADNHLLDYLCVNLTKETTIGGEVARFADFLQDMFTATHSDASHWDMLSLTDTNATGADAAARAWTYQVCDLFGWFQVAPAHDNLRSPEIDVAYHIKVCQQLFQAEFEPDVKWVSELFGDNTPAGTQTFFTNGDADPWHALSVLTANKPILRDAKLIHGTSHCADLHASSDTDPQELKDARNDQFYAMEGWLKGSTCPDGCNGLGDCVFGKCSCGADRYGVACEKKVLEGNVDTFLWVFIPLMMVGLGLLLMSFSFVLCVVFANLPFLYATRKWIISRSRKAIRDSGIPGLTVAQEDYEEVE